MWCGWKEIDDSVYEGQETISIKKDIEKLEDILNIFTRNNYSEEVTLCMEEIQLLNLKDY
jgi:hypothetical protein